MRRLAFVLFLSAYCGAGACYACPAIGRIPDFNCDQKLQIVAMGDSLVSGFGDTQNQNHGGYVLRAAKKLSYVNIANQGIPGLKTRELLDLLRDTFSRNKNAVLRQQLLDADMVLLDLGRNDRWLFVEPSYTYRNLKRAAGTIKSEVKKRTGAAPLVVKAVLMLPNRGSQGPWVRLLNELILRSSSKNDPADLRFDLVSKRLLSADQIHPTVAGYAALSRALVSYITKKLPAKMLALRPDLDGDGIFDLFEGLRFGTDPHSFDTDGDGAGDGDELFILGTDPLSAG